MLNKSDQNQIQEILERRANEIAGFLGEYRETQNHYGSVELALSREIDRLRKLANKVNPRDDDDI